MKTIERRGSSLTAEREKDLFKEFLENLPSGNKAKGTSFEEFCVNFLPLQKNFDIEKAWMWDDWPHKWGTDLGIDFVAKNRDGSYWAGQSKALKEDAPVSKGDVDSFLNESAGMIPGLGVYFSRRLLITTGNGLGRNAKSAILRRGEIPTTVVTRDQLFEWVLTEKEEASKGPRKTPKRHQHEAIEKAVDHFRTADKGQLIMACGTGKTLTALWIYEALAPQVCVVALPSLSLMEQTLQVWTHEAISGFKALSICSDETVAPSMDEMVSSVLDVSIPVTTKWDQLATEIKVSGPKVIFTTYASFGVLTELIDKTGLQVDLTIADEAHRTVGQQGRRMSLIHDPEKFTSKKTMFLTATPRVVLDDKRGESGDVEFTSMDNEDQFGQVFHTLSFFDAIHKEKLLVDYEIHSLVVQDDHLFENLAIDAKVKGDEKERLQTLFDQIIPAVFSRFVTKNKIRSAISYHSRKDRARSFTTSLNQIAPDQLEAFFVSGEMSAGQRKRNLDRLTGDGSLSTVLTNARCLTEGIDVPSLDAVAFIDPRYSVTDIVQAVGRVLRTAPGKQKGHILVPLIVNSVGEVSRESYMGIMRVIRAIESHDPSLTDEIKAISAAIGAGKEPTSLSKLRIENLVDLPSSVTSKVFSDLMLETVDAFSVGLGNLIDFINVYHREPARGEEHLGRWPEAWRSKLRSNYNAGVLSERRIKEVEDRFREAFGEGYWTWDPQLAHDLEMADHLQEFIDSKLEGGTYYPYVRVHRRAGKSLCQHGLDVGLWSFSLNVRARRSGLNPKLKSRVDQITHYTVNDTNVETFWWALERYVEFRDANGYPPDGDYRTGTFGTKAKRGYPLGDTVANWRATRKRAPGQGAMPTWKVEALNKVNFEWTVPRGNFRRTERLLGENAEARVQEVAEFMAEMGRRPRRNEIRFKVSPEADMYSWITGCVSGRKTLTGDQIAKLGKLGIDASKSRRI